MSSNIEKLEEVKRELEKAIKVENEQKWKQYLDRLKKFLEKLKGKTLISWNNNGNFYIFKVLDYEECYDTSVGFYGQWHPKRYYVLKTSGYLSFTVPDDKGKTYGFSPPRIENVQDWWNDHTVPYGCTKLIKIKGKNKDTIIFPKFDFKDCNLGTDVVALGKFNYDNTDPNADKALNDFIGFKKILKNDSIFEKALELYKEHTLKVMEFYSSFKTELQEGNKYLYEEFNETI